MANNETNTSMVIPMHILGASTFILAWGFSSNIFMLSALVKSKMTRDIIGQFMVNEIFADMSLHLNTVVFLIVSFYTPELMFGMALVVAFAGIKCFSLMGLSIVLCIAVCDPFRYQVHITVKKVKICLATTWFWIPLALCYVYLEGTFYRINEFSNRLDPNYTADNWWVGVLNLSTVIGIPFVVITTCMVKIAKHQNAAILNNCNNSRVTESKIRLAKLNTGVFILYVLSQFPFHIVLSLHVINPFILATGVFFYLMYPLMKLLLYLALMRNFRRAAAQMCGCGKTNVKRLDRSGTSVSTVTKSCASLVTVK